MPRPDKNDPNKWSSERYDEEARKADAMEQLADSIMKMAPHKMTPKTIAELLASQRGGARSGINLTLSIHTQAFINHVAQETGLSRGRVIDWALMELADHYLESQGPRNEADKRMARLERAVTPRGSKDKGKE